MPARTTLLSVRSSTLNVFALPPALISSRPEVVVTPATLTLSRLVCPSTSKSPLASIAPVNVETPVTPSVFSVVCPETVRPNSVPSDVSEEFTTPEPNVVAERTSVPLIL